MDVGSFVRFFICLAAGLFGLCATLSILLETLLAEWDLAGDLLAWLGNPRRRRPLFAAHWKREQAGRAEIEPEASPLPSHGQRQTV